MKTILRAFILCSLVIGSLTYALGEEPTIQALTGRWRLVEFYNDIGDGKGHLNWQKVDQKTAQTLEFKGDGTFAYTMATPNPHGHTRGTYVVEKSKKPGKPVIGFTWAKPAVSGEATKWKSSIVALKADQLELSGPGIEGSGLRYSREK